MRKRVQRAEVFVLSMTGIAIGSVFSSAPISVPPAYADSCPAVEVDFARGTSEPPGPGALGQVFIDSLSERSPARPVGSYSVDYSAAMDTQSLAGGANDLSAHVQQVVAACPDTKIVLGGYSQGAAVVSMVTVQPLPEQPVSLPLMGQFSVTNIGFDQPLPSAAFPHIAAVALFANPVNNLLGKNLPVPDGLRSRTTDICADDDTSCQGSGGPFNLAAHTSYVPRGLVNPAVDFVVGKLGSLKPPAPADAPR